MSAKRTAQPRVTALQAIVMVALLIWTLSTIIERTGMTESATTDVSATVEASFLASEVFEYLAIFGIAFIVVFGFIRHFLLEPYKIPSGSMEDTLLIGDRVLVLKFAYGIRIPGTNKRMFVFSKPKRGDVFVFSPKHRSDTHYIKRVVAVGGDTVQLRGKTLLVNNEPILKETYVKHTDNYSLPDFPPFQGDLVPYFFEAADVAPTIGDMGARQLINVEEKDGKPSRARVEGLPTYDVRIVGEDKETSRRVPVRAFYYVDLDNEQTVKRGILYQNRNSKQWYFITRTPKHEYRLTHTDATYTVPPDHYFAMGDNRENSEDSRSWGPVPFDVVKGKAVMVYWSTDGDSTAPGWQFWNRIRLERTGKRIRSQYGATPKRLSGNTSRR